jgi:cytidylate kinase
MTTSEELRKRDDADKTRQMGALRLVPDAFFIDTSSMTIDEVLEECLTWCKQKGIVCE